MWEGCSISWKVSLWQASHITERQSPVLWEAEAPAGKCCLHVCWISYVAGLFVFCGASQKQQNVWNDDSYIKDLL